MGIFHVVTLECDGEGKTCNRTADMRIYIGHAQGEPLPKGWSEGVATGGGLKLVFCDKCTKKAAKG